MKNLKRLKETYIIIKKLSQGIDPIRNIQFQDYDLLNEPSLKKAFEDVCEFLKVLEKEYYDITKLKAPFKILDKEAIKSVISDEDVIITDFVNKINKVNNNDMMKKLQTKTITSWLMKYGYLKEEVVNEKVRRLVTKVGKEIGIYRGILSEDSSIVVNFYSRFAQEFIIKHLEDIIVDDNKIND